MMNCNTFHSIAIDPGTDVLQVVPGRVRFPRNPDSGSLCCHAELRCRRAHAASGVAHEESAP